MAPNALPKDAKVKIVSDGLAWACLPQSSTLEAANDGVHHSLAQSVRDLEDGCSASANALEKVLRGAEAEQPHVEDVQWLCPETMPAMTNGRWDGDGQYDMSWNLNPSPPTLGHIVYFARLVMDARRMQTLSVHVSSAPFWLSGAILCGAVMILCDNYKAKDAWSSLKTLCGQMADSCGQFWDRFPPPFDKGGKTTSSSLSVLGCLQGLEEARGLNWLPSLDEFSIREWKLLRQKYDASWLIPGEILALGDPSITWRNPVYPELQSESTGRPLSRSSSPSDEFETSSGSEVQLPYSSFTKSHVSGQKPISSDEMQRTCSELRKERNMTRCPSARTSMLITDDYDALAENSFAEFFARSQIGLLVRLNFANECSEQSSYQDLFRSRSISMVSFAFMDGSAPPAGLAKNFVNAVEEWSEKSHDEGLDPCIAVHCKGGLGRTAAMVGAYAMQKHGISAEAFHGWVRIARPGSVQTTEQERYLREYKTQCVRRASTSRLRITLTLPTLANKNSPTATGTFSPSNRSYSNKSNSPSGASNASSSSAFSRGSHKVFSKFFA